MKRILNAVVVVVFCLLTAVSPVIAEEKQDGMMEEKMAQGSMMGKEMMGDEKDMDHGKMMKMCPMMMGKAMVATSDGGVIVLIGNKLQKYDKNLALKQETEIAVDMEGMKKKMGKCPMRDKMMKEHSKSALEGQHH